MKHNNTPKVFRYEVMVNGVTLIDHDWFAESLEDLAIRFAYAYSNPTYNYKLISLKQKKIKPNTWDISAEFHVLYNSKSLLDKELTIYRPTFTARQI